MLRTKGELTKDLGAIAAKELLSTGSLAKIPTGTISKLIILSSLSHPRTKMMRINLFLKPTPERIGPTIDTF